MEMGFSLILALISLILCIIFSLYHFPFFSRIRKPESESPLIPPGSFGLPIIGETLGFLSAGKRGAPENFVLNKIKKYSSKVFKTTLIGERMVLLASPEGNKFLFSNENKLVKSWWPPSLSKIFNPSGIQVEDGALEMRQLFLPHLKPDSLQSYVPIMDFATKQHLKMHWEGREVVKVYPLTRNYTFSLACRLFLGIEDHETVASLEKPFDHFTKAMFTLPLNIPGTYFHSAMKAREQLQRDIEVLIAKWKRDSMDGSLSSSSQSFLAAVLEENVEDENIAHKVLTLLVAAYDTTSIALTSITKLLAQFPHVYRNVLAEQREIGKSKAPGEMLNWKDIQKMKYSWNVASEVLRLHPSVPGSFREAISDFTYEGFLIPKGWKLHWNAYATHKNPDYFKEPEKFDPSRFEGDGPVPYSYVPFGGGPRMCPGKEYARIEILVFMYNLVSKFRWEMVFPDEKLVCNPNLKPTKDLPVRLYPHQLD